MKKAIKNIIFRILLWIFLPVNLIRVTINTFGSKQFKEAWITQIFIALHGRMPYFNEHGLKKVDE